MILEDVAGELDAAHSRHDDVRQDEVDAAAFKVGERLISGFRSHDLAAKVDQ